MCEKSDAVMKEYAALREEILLWTKTELNAITILFSIDTTLLVIIFYYKTYNLLFLIPYITFLGAWLWLADHSMIRILSAYVSEVVEKKKIVDIIGTMPGQLYIGWDTFVQNMPRQLRERGADRTTIVIVLVLINTIVPLTLIHVFKPARVVETFFKTYYDVSFYASYTIFALIIAGCLTAYILVLSVKNYSEILLAFDYSKVIGQEKKKDVNDITSASTATRPEGGA